MTKFLPGQVYKLVLAFLQTPLAALRMGRGENSLALDLILPSLKEWYKRESRVAQRPSQKKSKDGQNPSLLCPFRPGVADDARILSLAELLS